MAGYNAGRTCALRVGSTVDGERWLRDHANADAAYIAGFEWALWDWADANGMVWPDVAQRTVSRDSPTATA